MNDNYLKIRGKDVKNNLINLSQLVFEVTDICNLNCKYCGFGQLYEGYDPRGRGTLSFKKACNIIDNFVKLWNENIETSITQPLTVGFYGGEPLICMKLIINIIQYVESLNIKSKEIHYNMTTNGLLLNKHMGFLVDKKINLLISLDGTENDHSYRLDHKGENSHKRVVDNINLLQRKHPDYFNKYIKFNTVLHNMNSVESAHKYIKNNFGKETTISQLNTCSIRKDKVREFIKMFQNVDSSIKKAINSEKLEKELFIGAPRIRRLTDYLYSFSGNMFDTYNSLFFNTKLAKNIPTGTCIPFFKKLFVTVNGKILPCERIDHEFAMGQVFDDKVELDFENIAEKFNGYVFRFIKQCNTCAYIRKCTRCVFQIDEVNCSDNKCSYYTSYKSFQNVVNENLDYLGKNSELYKRIMKEVIIRN